MNHLENQSDFFIWQRFQSGDREAYSLVFTRHYSSLYDYCLRISNDIPFTEDCLQDFFIYIIEKRQSLKALDSIEPYLFVSFRRFLFRRLKRLNGSTRSLSRTDILFENDDFELDGVRNEISIELRRKLNLLTWSQREAIYLRYYNNLSLEDIALIMNMNYQSVANTLFRALTKIRSDKKFLKILNRTASLAFLSLLPL